MQDQPDQTTLSMCNDADGLIMSKAQDATAIDNIEDASFYFYGGEGTTSFFRPKSAALEVLKSKSALVSRFLLAANRT